MVKELLRKYSTRAVGSISGKLEEIVERSLFALKKGRKFPSLF